MLGGKAFIMQKKYPIGLKLIFQVEEGLNSGKDSCVTQDRKVYFEATFSRGHSNLA